MQKAITIEGHELAEVAHFAKPQVPECQAFTCLAPADVLGHIWGHSCAGGGICFFSFLVIVTVPDHSGNQDQNFLKALVKGFVKLQKITSE